MFNICILSGKVCNEPEVEFFEYSANTTFELAIWIGPEEAGQIKVSCYKGLAVAAAKSIHKGDRVAVMGCVSGHLDKEGRETGPHEHELLALDLELIRSDSRFQGLGFADEEPS